LFRKPSEVLALSFSLRNRPCHPQPASRFRKSKSNEPAQIGRGPRKLLPTLDHSDREVIRMLPDSELVAPRSGMVIGFGKRSECKYMKARSLALTLLCCILAMFSASATPHGTHSPRVSSGHHSTERSSRTSRRFYGGGHHTTSHGGNYPGETNAHHRNGHYQNWRTANRYGVHKPR
jgi:hypothetical protein